MHRAPDSQRLDYASWKDRRPLAAAIRPIYTAVNAKAAEAELNAFEQGPWGQRFPTVVAAWRHVIPFLLSRPRPAGDLHDQRDRKHQLAASQDHQKPRPLPSDDAASKLLWLALRNITADWGRATKEWKEAMNQFAILYEDRFTRTAT